MRIIKPGTLTTNNFVAMKVCRKWQWILIDECSLRNTSILETDFVWYAGYGEAIRDNHIFSDIVMRWSKMGGASIYYQQI